MKVVFRYKIVKELPTLSFEKDWRKWNFASKIQPVIRIDNITDIETAFDLMPRLDPTFDTETIDCIDIVPVIKQWQNFTKSRPVASDSRLYF